MSSVSDFSTDQVFNTREELIEWVKNEARSHRQVIVIKRSKTKNGILAKIIFMCERGGITRSKVTPDKSKPSKKIDCKFEMVAKFSKTNPFWSIMMINPVHNHPSITCFPLWSSAPELQQHRICVIARVNGNHFVKVDLQGPYPIPPTHPQWNRYKYDAEWERPYKTRQDLYIELRRSYF